VSGISLERHPEAGLVNLRNEWYVYLGTITDGQWITDTEGKTVANLMSSLEARLLASLLVILADQLDHEYG
jgi:hypothetical protein